MSQTNVENIRQMYEAAGKGDMQTALSALDENLIVYEQESLPYGGQYRGHAGFQKLFENLSAHWDDFKFTPQDFKDAEDTVVAVIQLTGKAKSTGKALDMTMYELWRMQNGKAVECRSIVWDTAKMLQILGEKQ